MLKLILILKPRLNEIYSGIEVWFCSGAYNITLGKLLSLECRNCSNRFMLLTVILLLIKDLFCFNWCPCIVAGEFRLV